MQKAKDERRVLLTRDLELYQQGTAKGVDVFLVEGSTEAQRLANLAKRFKFKLEINVEISRCPKCNTRIKPVSKDKILERIPKTTASHYDEFWLCPNCSQVYWRGAHWKRIENTLEEAKVRLGVQ